MARRSKSELEFIQSQVNFTYNNFGRMLRVYNNEEFNGKNELGYCYKAYTDQVTNYTIVTRSVDDESADRCILSHEYGHIYLGHMDGIDTELYGRMIWTIQNRREELIQRINTSCGIDYGDKLITRLTDDPYLVHSINNIAMDMEVNTRVLSPEDIDYMQEKVTSKIREIQGLDLGKIKDNLIEAKEKTTGQVLTQEERDQLDEEMKRFDNETKVKFILPSCYHYPDGRPFEDELTYPEYFMLIIENLDQFIKMLVNITKSGGRGDTSQVSDQDCKDALNGDAQGDSGNSGQSGQGQGQGQGQSGSDGLSQLMKDAGMSPDANKTPPKDGDESESKYKHGNSGSGNDGDKDGQGSRVKDHGTPEKEQAGQDLKDHKIQGHSGQPGCSQTGSAEGYRNVDYTLDPIDMAIDEVMRGFKNRVTKREVKREVMRKYNRGINRKVISPSYKFRNIVSKEPKIVYLIDVSGSMATSLIDRILKSISIKMKTLHKGLRYDIIAWSTQMEQWIQDIDPRKPIPSIASGGGTRLAGGFRFFRAHYDKNCIFILISDFEDYLEEWAKEESQMSGYTMYGFNYGYHSYSKAQNWRYFKEKNFTSKDGY